jgi:diaminohydroxyphosphoribosylaminopyrimidine deaminase/5-amino-6-(5-phosphoribosylamino)uracil reductase
VRDGGSKSASDIGGKCEIVGEGWHRQYGGPHAEVECFRDAERRMQQSGSAIDMKDCTLYVSLEPCSHYGKTPPCAQLIIDKGVGRVVAGMKDPNPLVAGKGIAMLEKAGIEVTVGVLEDECRELNRRFLCLHEKHRPYVILKWAQSEDGFLDRNREITAVKTEDDKESESAVEIKENGGPVVLSSAVTKQLVHKMRAENMAIMVGTRTALLDNPKLLTTRWAGRDPVRVLPDRHGVVSRDSNIFSGGAETIVYSERTDFEYILSDLAKRGIHSLIVEGGAQLLRSVIESGLWDEMHVEVAPVTIGSGVPAPPFPSDAHLDMEIDSHRLWSLKKQN